jgi:hypothetical protein
MKSQEHKDFVENWIGKIKKSLTLRKKFVKYNNKTWEEICEDSRKYYRSDWKGDIIPVNRIFSFGRSLIPAVYFRSPRVSVTATKPELVMHAKVVEAVDNYLIKKTKLKKTLKTAALHAYLSGYGPIKLGYDSEFGYDPSLAADEDYATATQYARKEKRDIEYHANVNPGMPWALPDLPENVIVPFGYRDPDSLPWIAHRILRPLEDVKQDQKYQNTKDLQGTRTLSVIQPQKKSLFNEDNTIKYAELIEIRDLSTRMIHVICEDQLLLSIPDVLQMGSLPWEFIIFNEDPEYFGGIPDIVMVEPQQLELNDIRTQASRHRKIALLKFLYLKGSIQEDELEKFFSGQVGPGIEVDAESLANAVSTLQPHVPSDLAAEAAMVKNDMRESLGFSENQANAFKGGTPPTASETMQVAMAAENRISERKDIMADALVNIIEKWNKFIFSFWTGERVVKIAGPDGAQTWVRFTGDQLKGDYDLNIDPDTGFPASKMMRQQAADLLLKTYGGDPLIDQIRLRELHLQQFEWLYPGVSNLVMQPSPYEASAAAYDRQPHPMGGGNPSTGNRGGGRQGSTPENPIDFERMVARHANGGKE